MNFFSIRTNHQETIKKIINGEKSITFNTLSWHKEEVKINDIIFVVISGDIAKKEIDYQNGLKAIYKVTNNPIEQEKHFSLKTEAISIFPLVLTKNDFYPFPDLKDAPNIGSETKNAPNQAFRIMDLETGKNVIRAIFDILDEKEIERIDILKKLVDNNLDIEKLVPGKRKKDIKITEDEIFTIDIFKNDITNINFIISGELSKRLISLLLTKPFLLLTGLSGSGKTKLAQAFSIWISNNKSQYCLIPVGADWTNREPLLGYPNALESGKYVKPDNGVLDLLIDANENPALPFFLILDEMNLSHVERYFADFLSAMESEEPIHLHSNPKGLTAQDEKPVPDKIRLPDNLFIIGTVNIDETTYMFSPKVLDRAGVIEFRVSDDEMKDFLINPDKIFLESIAGKGAGMAADFVQKAGMSIDNFQNKEEISTELLRFFNELKKAGAEFGYRTASDIFRYAGKVRMLEESSDTDKWDVNKIIDTAVIQKLLPKLHGSRRKLEPVLKSIAELCLNNNVDAEIKLKAELKSDYNTDADVKYPVSFEKIHRMYSRLINDGFTSFAEA